MERTKTVIKGEIDAVVADIAAADEGIASLRAALAAAVARKAAANAKTAETAEATLECLRACEDMQADMHDVVSPEELTALRRTANKALERDEEVCARLVELEEEIERLEPLAASLREGNRRVLDGLARDAARLGRIAARQLCHGGELPWVTPERSEAALVSVSEERELALRDVTHDCLEKLDASAALDVQLRALYAAHQQRVRRAMAEHDALVAALARAFDYERHHLGHAYRTLTDVNHELRFHVRRGTHHQRPTQQTPEERAKRVAVGDQQREVARLDKDVAAAMRELAGLERAVHAAEEERGIAAEQFELDRDDRVQVMNEFGAFVAALREEQQQWLRAKADLEELERKARRRAASERAPSASPARGASAAPSRGPSVGRA